MLGSFVVAAVILMKFRFFCVPVSTYTGVESGHFGREVCKRLYLVCGHDTAPDSHCWRPREWGGTARCLYDYWVLLFILNTCLCVISQIDTANKQYRLDHFKCFIECLFCKAAVAAQWPKCCGLSWITGINLQLSHWWCQHELFCIQP